MVEGFEGGITLPVKRQRRFGETLTHRSVHHVAPDGRFLQPTAIQFYRVVAVHEDVVDDLVISSAAQEGGALHLIKNVAENFRAADAVVHVNAH